MLRNFKLVIIIYVALLNTGCVATSIHQAISSNSNESDKSQKVNTQALNMIQMLRIEHRIQVQNNSYNYETGEIKLPIDSLKHISTMLKRNNSRIRVTLAPARSNSPIEALYLAKIRAEHINQFFINNGRKVEISYQPDLIEDSMLVKVGG